MTKRADKRGAGVRGAKHASAVAPGELVHRPFAGIAVKGRVTARPGSPTRPVARPPSQREDPSDAETFARYMAGVRALDGGATRIPATASEPPKSAKRVPRGPDPDHAARERMAALVSEQLRFEVTDDGQHVEGRRLDVDPRELRRVRRGQLAIDGKLDLHEMTLAEARAAVEAFVRKRRAEGDRLVLIVHGRGKHSPRGMPVLRGEIGAWLSQGKAAKDVAAFTSLPDQSEGGPGAVWVLLAR